MGSRCYECGDSGCVCSRCHANPDHDPDAQCSCPKPWELLDELVTALGGVGIDGSIEGRDRWYGSLWTPVHDGVVAARSALADLNAEAPSAIDDHGEGEGDGDGVATPRR